MKEVRVFLGSSFILMYVRKMIGDTIRLLNDDWLKCSVRIRLYIWEDFTIGYSGKHKQQEYINELVLPSDICIFIFSHRVGVYTKMELEAKLRQDKGAVFCFRMPYKGSWKQPVLNDLNAIGANIVDIRTAEEICKQVKTIVENYIKSLKPSINTIIKMNELYFYTTIPDDLPNIQAEIGTTIRNLDDVTMDEWGLHCILHPRKEQQLLDETDHYIPILQQEISDDDYMELSEGKNKAADPAHRMKRMTVFDMGNISKENSKMHALLNGSGIFTDKIKEMGTLKWGLYDWLRKERKKLFSNATVSFEANNGMLSINNIPIAPLDVVDESGKIGLVASLIDRYGIMITNAIATNEEDKKLQSIISERNEQKTILNLMLTSKLNDWTRLLITLHNTEERKIANECINIESKVHELLKYPINQDIIQRLKTLLLQRESLERQLVIWGCCSPLRLLSYQLYMVGIFDTYLHSIAQLKEEDELYARIITDAENFGIKDPNVEMMRMNLGNMHSRQENYAAARKEYIYAISNLQAMYDDSISMARNITYVLTHLFHLEKEVGTNESITETLMMFKEHISRLDISQDAFLIDQCMYATAELISIDIEDNSMIDVVRSSERHFREANEKLHITPDEMVYGDVFVYLPNMIAGYYIDHYRQFSEEIAIRGCTKAEELLKIAWNNCLKLTKFQYAEGLFHQGELKHQLAFLYASCPHHWEQGLNSYEEALIVKRRLYELTGNQSEEPRIAQTLVNYGALELEIIKNQKCFKPTKRYEFNPLAKANDALRIYKRHLQEGNKNSELVYYEALLLKATILDTLHKKNPQEAILYNEAIQLYFQCWCWNKDNPTNQYRRNFVNIAGVALKERKVISEAEFEEVKIICRSIA